MSPRWGRGQFGRDAHTVKLSITLFREREQKIVTDWLWPKLQVTQSLTPTTTLGDGVTVTVRRQPRLQVTRLPSQSDVILDFRWRGHSNSPMSTSTSGDGVTMTVRRQPGLQVTGSPSQSDVNLDFRWQGYRHSLTSSSTSGDGVTVTVRCQPRLQVTRLPSQSHVNLDF